MTDLCPCGSSKTYQECCQIAHTSHSKVTSPEQLMRSRFCAHITDNLDYVLNTYHPSCKAESQRAAIAKSIALNWVKLDVISTEFQEIDDIGYVTFKAFFVENGQIQSLSECSRFVKENDLWYYIDGEVEESNSQLFKVGRNDPCLCGSGKKFKKCCGKN